MSDREVHRSDDLRGAPLSIRRNLAGEPPAAIVVCDPGARCKAAVVPPHEVPKAARALYEAAGLPVPELPDIPDEALVEALAKDLADLADESDDAGLFLDDARHLLARGWGRTS